MTYLTYFYRSMKQTLLCNSFKKKTQRKNEGFFLEKKKKASKELPYMFKLFIASCQSKITHHVKSPSNYTENYLCGVDLFSSKKSCFLSLSNKICSL